MRTSAPPNQPARTRGKVIDITTRRSVPVAAVGPHMGGHDIRLLERGMCRPPGLSRYAYVHDLT